MDEDTLKDASKNKLEDPLEELSMIIKYWGVRGSIPAPLTTEQIRAKEAALLQRIVDALNAGAKMLEEEGIEKYIHSLPLSISGTYGGNTTCLEIQVKDTPLIMIDAGTGARELGKELLGRIFSNQKLNPLGKTSKDQNIHLFLTHYHWDHIQGFPFFGPAFVKHPNMGAIEFYGKADARVRLSEVLAGQQQYPQFPVEWKDMACVVGDKQYHELGRMTPSPIKIGEATVSYTELDHPDRSFAYAIEAQGKKFVCATDTEHRDTPDPALVKLAQGADILYYDGQYLPEEYSGKKGMHRFRWGHSTYEWAVKTASAAGVKMVVLGHHEPTRDDFGIEELLARALKFRDEFDPEVEVVAAYEGLQQKL